MSFETFRYGTVAVENGFKGPYFVKVNNTSLSICHLVPANITSPPSTVRIPLGEETTLSCTAYGYPVPTLSWFYHEKAVTETDRVVVNSTVSEGKIMITSSLKFKEVTRQDSGVYTCEADNLIGAVMAETANLMVLGK